jgi:excisionase family DNA binding protein
MGAGCAVIAERLTVNRIGPTAPAPAAPARPLLTTPEAAEFLAVKPGTLSLWGRQGRIKPVKLGAAVRWRPEDLERFVNGD